MFNLFTVVFLSTKIFICILVWQVAARKVQVLNSVNSKLPFLVTTADDAKDSLKEEIRLR